VYGHFSPGEHLVFHTLGDDGFPFSPLPSSPPPKSPGRGELGSPKDQPSVFFSFCTSFSGHVQVFPHRHPTRFSSDVFPRQAFSRCNLDHSGPLSLGRPSVPLFSLTSSDFCPGPPPPNQGFPCPGLFSVGDPPTVVGLGPSL